jgi:copper chaperone CopZ
VKADQEKHQVTLTFDSDIISEENIKEKLEDAGFSVKKIDIVEVQKK